MLSCLGPSDGSVSAPVAASTSGGSGSPAPPSSPSKAKLSLTLPPSANYEPTEEMLSHAQNVKYILKLLKSQLSILKFNLSLVIPLINIIFKIQASGCFRADAK